jgi:hypothetical protein
MEIELPFGVESALRTVERTAPQLRIDIRLHRGVVEQVEVPLSRTEAVGEVVQALTKAGFRIEAEGRYVWTKERGHRANGERAQPRFIPR